MPAVVRDRTRARTPNEAEETVHVVAISVGGPREVEWNGNTVRTSIFKAPVAGPVRVNRTNLEGDAQSDLSVHGGPLKAVYAYPSEHYAAWRAELPDADLRWGAFGENLTTAGLLESDVSIGDRFRVGTAEFVVTQPRMPCYKLGIRFGRPEMVKRLQESGRNGFYLAVAVEGVIQMGDPIERLATDSRRVSVASIVRLYDSSSRDIEGMLRVSEHPGLPPDWREHFRKRAANAASAK
jgi:MOSC domain-containing protein YiiM